MKTKYPSLSERDILTHLEEIKRLKAGWLWGDGKSFEEFNMELAWAFIKELTSASTFIPYPYVYPSEEGCLSLEWDLNGWMLSYDFSPGKPGHFHAYHPESQESRAQNFEAREIIELREFINKNFLNKEIL